MGITETSSLSTFTCTLHTQTASHTHSHGWPAPYASSHICLQCKYRFCKGWPSFLHLHIITDTRISILETLVHLYLFLTRPHCLVDDADMDMHTIPHVAIYVHTCECSHCRRESAHMQEDHLDRLLHQCASRCMCTFARTHSCTPALGHMLM